MAVKLYLVHGSHPCRTVQKALELKGVDYEIVEFPPPFHALAMRALFGGRTVPAVKFEDGTKIQGSREILRALDERHPEPPLLPSDPAARAKVLDAERWGDDILQPLARRLLWPALKRNPVAIHSFQAGGKLPPLPKPVIAVNGPLITRIEMKMNAASEERWPEDLRALPSVLDHVDALLADGVLGGPTPNAADLQIAPSILLIRTIEDLAPIFAGRPCVDWALTLYPAPAGTIPSGVVPRELVAA